MPFPSALLAALTEAPEPLRNPLAGWPQWLQIAAGIVVGGVALWIALKLLRVALWVALVALLVSAVAFFLRGTGLFFMSHR